MEIKAKLDDLFKQSQFKEGIELINQYLEYYSFIYQEKYFYVKLMEIRFLSKLENFTQSAEIIDALMLNPITTSDRVNIALLLVEKAKIKFLLGNIDAMLRILENIEEHLIKFELFGDPRIPQVTGDIAILRGGYFWQNGELENALYYFKLNYKIREPIQDSLDTAHALNNLGVIQNAMGNFNEAIVYLNNAYKNYKKTNFYRGMAKTGNNLGAIYLQLGDLNESQKIISEALAIDIREGYNDGILVASQNLGEIFWHKREYSEAIQYFQQALDMCQVNQNFLQISELLVPYIIVLLENKNLSRTISLLDLLSSINSKKSNKLVNQRFLLCKALVIRNSDEYKSIDEVIQLLSTIINDKVRYFDVSVMATSYICEILIHKAEVQENPEILEKVECYLDDLIEFADQSNSYYILAKVYWLYAELQIYRLKFKAAQENLIKAFHIVVKYELHQLEAKILHVYDRFLKSWAFWEQDSNFDLTTFKKQQVSQLRLQMKSLFLIESSNHEESSEERPVEFRILERNGTNIAKFNFDFEWTEDTLFYKAFQISFYEGFKQFLKQGPSIIQVGIYRVLFMKFHKNYISYIYVGPSYYAYQKFIQFKQLMNRKKHTFEDLRIKLESNVKTKDNHQQNLHTDLTFLQLLSIFTNN